MICEYELHDVKVKIMIVQWKEMINLDRSVNLGENQVSLC
jgi:hypothetical protein